MDQYIGKMLDNRYEILERIGTGGMAVVYKAKCHRLNRLVAIKILKSDLAQDEDFRRRFNAESQAVAQLSHPNIVSVYDVSKGGDIEYIVMELIDGITLKQYMEKRGQLNWRESLHFITQIMRGLSHAHSRGIVHRDIKPQNIMVLRDGSVKVADFGIACLENSAQTLTQEALGSVHYISPEQARGDRTDARSDIYSAGVVFYEMLTNRLPFEGDSAVSVAIQHLSSIPLAPREINPEIPEPLELICMKAMAPDLDRRYSSADAMIADLEAFRKNPDVNLDFEMNDLRPNEPDEPTRLIRTNAVSAAVPHYNAPARDAQEYDRERNTRPESENRVSGPGRGRKKKSTGLIVGAVCVALVAVGFLFWMILGSFGSENVQYTVPSVVGHTVDEANEMDGVKGIFTIDVTGEKSSEKYAKDVIMSQDPADGDIRKGSNLVIHVVVSSGENTGKMIDVTGEEDREAKLELEKMQKEYDLTLTIDDSEDLQEYSDEVNDGYVIRTDPAAGETIKNGDTIKLIVSKGTETKSATVILFQGSQIDLVQQQLKTLGLKCGEVKEVESDKAAGIVLTQSIPADTVVDVGTSIDFTVSKGDGSSTGQSSEIVSVTLPTDGRTTVHIQIVQDGKVVADEPAVDCSQGTYAKEIFGSGSSTVEIYIDGSLYETKTVTFDE